MTDVILSGPLLSGAGPDVVVVLGELVQEEIAQAANERVHAGLNRHIRHPTPYYETQIIGQRLGDAEVIHDRGIVYGPWLEGTSTRNRTTRFKGYHVFRDATRETQQRAQELADRVLARELHRLGG